jgi:hypothetical protein
MKIEFKEVYPAVRPYYQLVGDEDDMFIFTEWLSERLSAAVFDMLKTPPSATSICRGPEIKI